MSENGLAMSELTKIDRILNCYRDVAVVGLSENPARVSNNATGVVMAHGYRITPVNPRYQKVFGLTCYPNLLAVPHPIDIVNLFQRSENVPPFVEQAIAIGAKVIWMQLGIVNEAAARRASDAGLEVIMDRCMKVELLRMKR